MGASDDILTDEEARALAAETLEAWELMGGVDETSSAACVQAGARAGAAKAIEAAVAALEAMSDEHVANQFPSSLEGDGYRRALHDAPKVKAFFIAAVRGAGGGDRG